MTGRLVVATAARVLAQLRHDHRTVVMLLALPTVLTTLLWWVFTDQPGVFDRIGGPLIAVFPFTVMFVVTSITTLRERRSGTLERLLALPLAKADLILGYALAFGLVAVVQALLLSAVALGPLDLDVAGPRALLVVVAVADALMGVAFGLLASAFAATEFQAVQFMPAFVFPQMLLCGLLVPRDQMPAMLSAVSNVLPLSYAVDAINAVTLESDPAILSEMVILTIFVLAALALGATTLPRQTP